jgi:hypothetical protein
MKHLLFLLFLTVFYKTSFTQTVEFYLPTLSGEEYLIYLNKGTQNDTVQKGVIAENGHFTFTLPEKNRDYAGIVNFVFHAVNQGFILNNENISIKAANPNENSFIFENSKENDFLFKQMDEFKEILQKTDAIYKIKEIFDENSVLYQAAEHEIAQLETIYQTKRNELANSNLYAARYIEIFHFLNGFISGISMSEQEKQIDAVRL